MLQVSENQAARFLAGRAEIIDELEGSLPAWFRRRALCKSYPKYIHFMKVRTPHPDSCSNLKATVSVYTCVLHIRKTITGWFCPGKPP